VIGEVVFFDTYGAGRHLWFVGLCWWYVTKDGR
jgi:hypothetical protein